MGIEASNDIHCFHLILVCTAAFDVQSWQLAAGLGLHWPIHTSPRA